MFEWLSSALHAATFMLCLQFPRRHTLHTLHNTSRSVSGYLTVVCFFAALMFGFCVCGKIKCVSLSLSFSLITTSDTDACCKSGDIEIGNRQPPVVDCRVDASHQRRVLCVLDAHTASVCIDFSNIHTTHNTPVNTLLTYRLRNVDEEITCKRPELYILP